MKFLRRLLYVLIGVPLLAALLLLITGNDHILRGLPSTYFIGKARPDIDDMQFHHVRTVEAASNSTSWPVRLMPDSALSKAEISYFDSLQSAAFLVVHCDTLIYERYGEGFEANDVINAFSMAKSFTSLAFGRAVDAGLIDVDAPVSRYLPRFSDGLSAELTVRHLLQMRSNIDFGESYFNPFGYQAKSYFGTDLWGVTAPYRVDGLAGTEWKYEGGNTVLLAEILASVTGESLSDYFSANIWQAIGAEHDAYWNLDRENGHEKAFSAFYATPRDFARIGQLMLHDGHVGARQVLSENWVEASLTPHFAPDTSGKAVAHYGFQWWLAPQDVEPWHFSARGMRGQYIVVLPEHELVIVRMGRLREEGRTEEEMTPDLPRWVAMGLKLAKKDAERY